MKPKARPLAIVATASAALLLAGCAQSGASGASTLERIESRGTLKVGSCLNQPPWGHINSANEPEGWDIDMGKFLADELGVDVEYVEVTSASRIPSLDTNKVDVISCSFTVNEERSQQIDFSDPIIYSGNSLLVKSGSSITSVEDLAGKKVAVSKGGTSIQITTDVAPDAIQQPYDSMAAAMLAVSQGQADAMIDNANSLTSGAKEHPDLEVVIDGDVGERTVMAFGLKKGDEEFLERINEAVASIHEQQLASASYTKWFEAEPTFQFEGLE